MVLTALRDNVKNSAVTALSRGGFPIALEYPLISLRTVFLGATPLVESLSSEVCELQNSPSL